MTGALRIASAEDVEAIMAIEQTPGYEGLVGRWPRERHLEEMAQPGSRYLVWSEDGRITGFAILQGLDHPDARTHLKRIAVGEAGRGAGARLLAALADWVFGETEANRLDLDVFIENERAHRAYAKAGFVTEGVLRDWHRTPDGFRSMYMMSLLRRDWEARGRA